MALKSSGGLQIALEGSEMLWRALGGPGGRLRENLGYDMCERGGGIFGLGGKIVTLKNT